MRDHFNEVSNVIDSLSRKHDRSRVFNDFLTMAVCTFHSTNIKSHLKETDDTNEALYMETIQPYSKDELLKFSKLLGEVQLQVYENPYSDMLGEYFTRNITRGENGQFFTPEPICKLMSNTVMEKEQLEYKTVLDPACGSGRTLLSFAEVNPNNHFYGADISETCAKMSAVNFCLNGLRGEVTQMNTLSMEFYKSWRINMDGIGIQPIDKTQSEIWTKPPEPPAKDEGQQLILF